MVVPFKIRLDGIWRFGISFCKRKAPKFVGNSVYIRATSVDLSFGPWIVGLMFPNKEDERTVEEHGQH